MTTKSYLCWLPGKYIGGAERYALNLSSKLVNSGVSVIILCPYYECYKQVHDLLKDETENQPSSVTILYCKAPSTSRFWKLPILRDLYLSLWSRKYQNLLTEIRPEAIHIVLPFPPRSYSFILAASRSLLPVTITYQLVPCPAHIPRRYYRLFRSLIPRASLCTVSKSNQQSIAEALDLPLESILYIPNRPLPCSGSLTTQESNYLLANLSLDPRYFLCTTVAALEPRKGHEDIIHACNILKDSEPNIRFLFIGTGKHESYLRSLVTNLGLDDYILFIGSRADVDSILQVSQAFIFPSSAEGLSFALMEAVQRMVPLIASNRCGANDFLIPSAHYREYEYANPVHLAHHITELQSSYEDSLEKARLAAIVLSAYNFDSMINATMQVLFR
jgi:glycosyltransferase involved in cell wall biosynthesis